MSGRSLGFSLLALVASFGLASPASAMTEWTLHRSIDGARPDGEEQQMLWLLNRARQSPTREGRWLAGSREFHVAYGRDFYGVDRRALMHAFAKIRPSPPAAFDRRLFLAALAHSRSQIARDVQDHRGQQALMSAEGFVYDLTRYNVFSYANNGLNAHAAFNIDWGPGTGTGMQQPPHHRLGIMAVDGTYSNVGIGGVFDMNPHNRVGQYVVSQDFARADESVLDHYNKFIVGTVWRDHNGNDRYDPGEGIPRVKVVPSRGGFYAITSAGGGYAIPITSPGVTEVDFRSVEVPPTSYTVTTADTSVLVDLKLNKNGRAAIGSRSRPSRIFLAPGVHDSRRFGNKWGNDRHERSVIANFAYSPSDLLLSFRSHYADRAGEIEVFVNGQKLDELGEQKLSRHISRVRYVIPASILSNSNRLDIRQRFDDEKWGVDKLHLAPASGRVDTLKRGQTLRGPYGFGRGGQGYRAAYRVLLDVAPSDYELHFEAFAQPATDDLEILLNGERLVFVAPTERNQRFATAHVMVAATDFRDGENVIEFRSRKSVHWGVRNLTLVDVSSPSKQLTVASLRRGRDGWGFAGALSRRIVRYQFIATQQDHVVSLRAEFAGEADAVSIHVNGRRIGQLAARDSVRGRYAINRSMLVEGTNTIEFRRKLRSPKAWSISDVLLRAVSSPELRLTLGHVLKEGGGRYGWQWGNSEHRTVVRTYVDLDAPIDLSLSTKAFNVTAPNQVALFVNDRPVDFLAVAPGRVKQNKKILVSKQLLVRGRNRIEFRNNLPNQAWGLADVSIAHVSPTRIPLEAGVTNYRRFDSDENGMLMFTEFESTGVNVDLSVVGFDIEASERVAVHLNDKLVGHLGSSLNDGHSEGERFFLPTAMQRLGRNRIEFRRQRPHSRWGVGRLTLTPESYKSSHANP